MKLPSGKFVIRMSSEMHGKLSRIAKERGVSLNQVCLDLLRKGLSLRDEDEGLTKSLDDIIHTLSLHFKDDLIGVVLFGSYATGEATPDSDIDLLIVLKKTVPIERGLYRWWDDNIIWKEKALLNPHFVCYPESAYDAGGLWLESATCGRIIFQRQRLIEKLFQSLKDLISEGKVRRYISNGHSYWIWRTYEE